MYLYLLDWAPPLLCSIFGFLFWLGEGIPYSSQELAQLLFPRRIRSSLLDPGAAAHLLQDSKLSRPFREDCSCSVLFPNRAEAIVAQFCCFLQDLLQICGVEAFLTSQNKEF